MKKLGVTCALACACLGLVGPAHGAINVGVADDRPVGLADNGAAYFALMNDVGLREIRLTVKWDPAAPTTIPNQVLLDALMPVATVRGIRVVFSVQPDKASSITDSPAAPAQFAAFLQQVARAYPSVKDFIVANEPNKSRFWQPQFDAGGKSVAPAAYEDLLAQSYDALKAVDPTINVIGVGLSPRGTDNPAASGNVAHSPVKFIGGLAAAYRASGRTKPLMDEFAFHPYPNKDTDPLMRGYSWPNAGMPNLDRIKQAFWDGFRGTGQKTFEDGLMMKLDEVGWQVAVIAGAQGAYFGSESIVPTDEATQAAIYAALLRYAACDPSVDSVLFFGFQDEANLDRWQAGLMRADGSHRPSYDSVKATIAETGGNCQGAMRSWRHSLTVDGAKATFRNDRRLPSRVSSWSLLAGADEDATFTASIDRAGGGHVLSQSGQLTAHVMRLVRFASRRLRLGRYVYSIRIRAAANPLRARRLTSRPFVVYRAR